MVPAATLLPLSLALRTITTAPEFNIGECDETLRRTAMRRACWLYVHGDGDTQRTGFHCKLTCCIPLVINHLTSGQGYYHLRQLSTRFPPTAAQAQPQVRLSAPCGLIDPRMSLTVILVFYSQSLGTVNSYADMHLCRSFLPVPAPAPASSTLNSKAKRVPATVLFGSASIWAAP